MTDGSHRLSPEDNERIFTDRIVPRELAGATAQRDPVVVFVGAQTGAGKTELTELVQHALAQRGRYLNINMDTVNPYHPDYAALRAADPTTASGFVRADGEQWWRRAMQHATGQRCDVVIETAMRDPSEFEELVPQFREAGYEVHTAAMAVPAPLSRLGVLSRYWGEVNELGHGRYVDREAHDACYDGVLRAAEAVDRGGLSHHAFVFRRGGVALQVDERAGETRDAGGGMAPTIRAERSRPWSQQETAWFDAAVRDLRDGSGSRAPLPQSLHAELDEIRGLAEPLRQRVAGSVSFPAGPRTRSAGPSDRQSTGQSTGPSTGARALPAGRGRAQPRLPGGEQHR